jgi:prefoldin subunit 5
LMNEAIEYIQSRIPALERSLEEIKLDWRVQ